MQKYLAYVFSISLLCLSCSRQDGISEAQNELSNFYNYSTVNWNLIDTLYYRPYNSDWPVEYQEQFDEEFPFELISFYWHRSQNAKTYFHQRTLPLRSGASNEFIKQLNYTESVLDTFFLRMVSQPYYMRLDVDCYQEIMPQEIDKCFESLTR